MIGGDDVVLDAPWVEPQDALMTGVRQVRREWTGMVVQDGETGRSYVRFSEIPFGRLRELMVYRDQEAFRSWAAEGAVPSNRHSMLHLIADVGALTIVADDRSERVTAHLIESMRQTLEFGVCMGFALEAA